MRWLENNPVGAALAGVCGLVLLVSAALAYIWSRPASSGTSAPGTSLEVAGESGPVINELGPITEYREVTTRPVFDETRRPSISVAENDIEIEEGNGEVADRPDVVLKGVIITPEVKMATLKPNSGAETVVAHEGVPLEGDYNGWIISDIKPRKVMLASLEGDTIELELQVNNRKIEEPPEPEPSPAAAALAAETGAAEIDDKPLSRAEEIRQRIAERREELRRQAEMEESESQSEPKQVSRYQSAIQNMINRKKDDEEEQEEKSDDGTDG